MDLVLQVRIVEPVGVANEFVRYQLKVRAGKGTAPALAEVAKRHLEGAANLRAHVVTLQVTHSAEAVGVGVGIEKRLVNLFESRAQHAVKPDGIRHESSSGRGAED